jgi:hypothetical protein
LQDERCLDSKPWYDYFETKMGNETGHIPKLRITFPFTKVENDVCDLEQAEHKLDWGNDMYIITVDGQVIGSYEELVQLANLGQFQNVEFLEVRLIPYIEGG